MLLLSALLAIATPADAMECGTPQALDALRGLGPATHAGMRSRPPQLTPPDGPPPPSRTHYGTPWDDHYDTEHFTINWWDPTVSPEDVSAAAEALEAGWQAFIDEQGWPAPVSSDQYFIWVLLDPGLGSTTGYTTEYFSDDYPEGYPSIYINPDTREAFGEAFYAALSVHEFMHAVQYGMRDYAGSEGDIENWYWEASATHASELAAPEVDGHQYTSEWYAVRPEVRYDSYEGSHQYGIFVFNAWLDHTLGAGSMRAVWEAGVDHPGEPWTVPMAAATGWSAPALWAGFTDAYGNRSLPESALYTRAATRGQLEDGAADTLAELGTHYWEVDEDTDVGVISGDVILGGTTEPGEAVTAAAGSILSVTALADGTDYVLQLAGPGELTTPEAPEDSGQTDSGQSTDDGTLPSDSSGDKGGCATAPAMGGLLVALVAVWRRRVSP